MSLYDDIDTATGKKTDTSNVAGWASGIKFMQNHVHLKKKSLPQPKREVRRQQQLAPVIAFKGKSNSAVSGNGSSGPSFILPYQSVSKKSRGNVSTKSLSFIAVDPEWQFDNEYDPYFPNEYEKALRELRERRDKEAEEEEAKRRLEIQEGGNDNYEMEDQGNKEKVGGVTIAPPASLHAVAPYNEDDQPFSTADMGKSPSSFGRLMAGCSGGNSRGGFGLGSGGVGSSPVSGATAAAKIMAKYGYKEGTGLGRMGQGMSTALQVEKTSHRIGRIIHEKDVAKEASTPNFVSSYIDDDEFEMEPPQLPEDKPVDTSLQLKSEQEQYAEDQLKNPSKVVLLQNMVGPGEVDDDLEPEVKEECQKYGEVVAVIVFQMPDVDSEDSIRIFVEFVKVTSAVKAFMDLNGRFFGGRQLKAAFYDPDKFNNLELTC